MLREARQIAGHSPRAALLIAFSAFEIGIKQHVAAQVPEASWLITNAPTPPVDKIFNKYLAELHKTVPFPEAVQKLRLGKQLQEFTKVRNALAHRGVLGQGELVRYLSLTRNALYLLDWLQGCEWAKDRLDNDFREAFCQSA
ncbi:hypothetical protein [Primorskyibacter sp. 2E233]|uniref:hypothetical protein n=1 Tax=Primorskyibacter sp. 2E233 TaxID=3413431 RepID=UPI003BF3B35E